MGLAFAWSVTFGAGFFTGGLVTGGVVVFGVVAGGLAGEVVATSPFFRRKGST